MGGGKKSKHKNLYKNKVAEAKEPQQTHLLDLIYKGRNAAVDFQAQSVQETAKEVNIDASASGEDDVKKVESVRPDTRSNARRKAIVTEGFYKPPQRTESKNYNADNSYNSRDNNRSYQRSDRDWDRDRKDQKFKHFENNAEFDRDEEYDKFNKLFRTKQLKHLDKIEEKFGDLFEATKDFSLAHCVAEDLNMGSGIAVRFKSEFKNLGELNNQRSKQGGLAVLENEGRFIYYLVTKRVSSGKPTYETLWKSLTKMRNHMVENKVSKLALPKIGCGLDRLEWSNVRSMLEYLFKDVDVSIVVYDFQQNYGKAADKKLISTSKEKKNKNK